MVAKEFRTRPSEYFPELSSYEAFCLDEVCAHALIKLREQANSEMGKTTAPDGPVKALRGASFEELERLQSLGR